MARYLPEEISLSDGESTQELDSDETRYIYQHDHGTVEIHITSLDCLDPTQYLNDSIVQFYLAYLLKEVCDEKIMSKVHIFDNLFHAQLDIIFQASIDVEKLQQLRKWIVGVDIFSKDFLIFPVCSGQHWFAIVVCYPSAVRSIRSLYEQKPEDSSQRTPGIIIMDSLDMRKRRVTAKVRDFLDYEWRDRRIEIKRFSHTDLKDYFAPFPKQKNAYDCGIFMLMYMKYFIEQPETVYSLIKKRASESASLFKEDINKLVELNDRSVIKDLIKKICKHSDSDRVK